MKLVLGTKQYLVVAGLVAGSLLSGCTTMQPRMERYVPPPIGSSWTEEDRNTGSYGPSFTGQITTTERTWEGKRVIAFTSPQGAFLMTTEGANVAIVGLDNKPFIRWDPYMNWDWPLEVGKTSTHDYRVTAGADRIIQFTRACTVKAYEDVSVPAGTFKVWKVDCSNTTGQEDAYWFSPELGIFVKHSGKRPASNPFGAGTQEMELVSQNIKK